MGFESSARRLVLGLSSAARDIRYAFRVLRRSPGFSAVAIATSALAIGANAAMFSFVNATLLRPLPYPDADRIVRVLETVPNGGISGISSSNYLDWTRQNASFEYMAAEASWRATLTGGDEPVSIRGVRVSAHYFDIFGTKAALGRTFRPGEDQPGRDRVVMLSHRLWETRFGSDPAVIGRTLSLNGEAHLVVGVLPAGPFDRAAAQIWKPLAFEPPNSARHFRWLGASAKMKAGVTVEAARADMDLIARRLAAAYPDSNKGWGVAVDRLADVVIGPGLRTAVGVLFAATLFVLLVGCANLANLALARGISRESEMSVRAALGASRWRLIRQLLLENLVMALYGGLAGVGVGYAMMRWMQWLIPPYSLPPAVDVRMDVPVLLFTLAAATATGLLFGAAPAAQATTPRLAGALRAAGQGTTAGSPRRRLRGLIVVAEVALAFVLLVASGLLMRSFLALREADLGFDATHVLTAGLPLPEEEHREPAELNLYLGSIRAAVEAVPGVRTTALTSALPLEGWGYGVPYSVAGRPLTDRASRRRAFFKVVSPSYFSALDIRLLAGRSLSDGDKAGGPRVAVVNETLAKREFGTESPIGHRLLIRQILPGRTEFGREVGWDIVGVVAGERISGIADEASGGLYVSNQQSPVYGIHLIVRARVRPESLQRDVRSAVNRVNPHQALSDVRTLEQIVDHSILANRFVNTLLTTFASIALLLSAVGIFGVVSFTAAERTHEMAIRTALGASPVSLRMLILRGGVRLALVGLAGGLVATVLTTDVLSAMLYGIGAYDPLTIAVAAAVLLSVAAVASWLPAWRLTTIDPAEALRRE